MVTVRVKKLNPSAVLPTSGSACAAGYDLYACLEAPVEVPPHGNTKIGTGLSVEIPDGYFGAVFARSGLAAKHCIRPSNCVGVCDSDYRGEYMVFMHNDSDVPYTVNPGDRIAQLVVMPYLAVNFEETDEELSQTGRGSAGFGSTGR